MTEQHLHHAIHRGATQGDGQVVERFADFSFAAPVGQLTLALDFAREVVRRVFDGRQRFREHS